MWTGRTGGPQQVTGATGARDGTRAHASIASTRFDVTSPIAIVISFDRYSAITE
ncbi:MAG TPA: hypothetical protein VFT22_16930 [Kofleriaceae bacterium]|nr:hypothetical protein [Kofleriaceae bacterium]